MPLIDLFEVFRNDRTTVAPVASELAMEEWIETRKATYEYYRNIFNPENLNALTEQDFHEFLKPSGNRSWTNLPRGCKRVTTDMTYLRRNIAYLQNEAVAITDRLNRVVRGGEYYVEGFGKNLTTGILHIINWERYGVWNSRSQKVLKDLWRLPALSYDFAHNYLMINEELNRIKDYLQTDLVYVDGFIWWLEENHRVSAQVAMDYYEAVMEI